MLIISLSRRGRFDASLLHSSMLRQHALRCHYYRHVTFRFFADATLMPIFRATRLITLRYYEVIYFRQPLLDNTPGRRHAFRDAGCLFAIAFS